jgi:hypothetical protein
MDKKAILLLVIIALGVGLVAFWDRVPIVNSNQTYQIKKIHIIEGHLYDIVLQDGRRILGKLEVTTPPEATKKIIELLNGSTNPEATLLDQEDHIWNIKLHVISDGKKIEITEWLRSNKLVWE